MSSPIIPFPTELRPRLPTILGNVDYLTFRDRLEQIDRLLESSGVERDFVERALKGWLEKARRSVSARQQQRFQVRSKRALRCTILRTLLQEDYRGFSCALAGNPLYQWFCLVDGLEAVRVPSKSELQRFAHWLEDQEMRRVINGLSLSALNRSRKLELKAPLDLESYFLDTTCLKANIHFPVDWVLLRDGVRTLMKATELIRKAGLKGRMRPPAGVSPGDEPAVHPDGPWPPGTGQSAGTQGDLEADEEAGENRPGPCPQAPGVTGQELGTDRVDAAPGRAGAWAYRRGSGAVAQSPEAGPRADHRWQAGGQLAEDLEPL